MLKQILQPKLIRGLAWCILFNHERPIPYIPVPLEDGDQFQLDNMPIEVSEEASSRRTRENVEPFRREEVLSSRVDFATALADC